MKPLAWKILNLVLVVLFIYGFGYGMMDMGEWLHSYSWWVWLLCALHALALLLLAIWPFMRDTPYRGWTIVGEIICGWNILTLLILPYSPTHTGFWDMQQPKYPTQSSPFISEHLPIKVHGRETPFCVEWEYLCRYNDDGTLNFRLGSAHAVGLSRMSMALGWTCFAVGIYDEKVTPLNIDVTPDAETGGYQVKTSVRVSYTIKCQEKSFLFNHAKTHDGQVKVDTLYKISPSKDIRDRMDSTKNLQEWIGQRLKSSPLGGDYTVERVPLNP